MRSLRLALAAIIAAFALAPAAAGTATTAPAFLCPHDKKKVIPAEQFPATWNLDNSKSYPDGARTCRYRHQGEITYRCKGSGLLTAINVVGDKGGRNEFAPTCNGKQHAINTKKAYWGLRGDVHIHWHAKGAGQYTDGMLRVA